MVCFSGQVRICVCIDVYVIEKSPFFAATRVLLNLLLWPALGLLLVRHWATCQYFFASRWRLSSKSPSALQTKELVTRRPPVRLQAYSCFQKMARFSRRGRADGFQGVRRAPGPANASSHPCYPSVGQGTVLVSGSNIKSRSSGCEFFEKVIPFRASVRQRFWDCMFSPFWVSSDCHVEYPNLVSMTSDISNVFWPCTWR